MNMDSAGPAKARDGGIVTPPRGSGLTAADRAGVPARPGVPGRRQPTGPAGRLRDCGFVVIPCALTLPVAVGGVLVSFVVGVMSCFDTCVRYSWWVNMPDGVATLFVAELIAGAAAVVILIMGLLVPRWRWALGIAGWGTCLLACAGVGLLHWYPQ